MRALRARANILGAQYMRESAAGRLVFRVLVARYTLAGAGLLRPERAERK